MNALLGEAITMLGDIDASVSDGGYKLAESVLAVLEKADVKILSLYRSLSDIVHAADGSASAIEHEDVTGALAVVRSLDLDVIELRADAKRALAAAVPS